MTLIRWQPLNRVGLLHDEINRLFNDSLSSRFGVSANSWYPSVDVLETKEEYQVRAELPGLNKEDIDISLTKNILTLKGERKSEKSEKDVTFYSREITYGSFVRQIELPEDIDESQVRAGYENGVLEVRIPRQDKSNKNIQVSIN